MKKSLLAFACCTIFFANPAFANGFNGKDLAKAAQDGAQSKNNDAVLALNATEVFRLQMAYSPKATMEALPEPIKQKLAIIFGEFNNKRQYQTGWFMAGAIAKAGENATQTRLYNPLAQIWLDIDWVKDGETMKIANVGAANAVIDDWTKKNGSHLLAFANSYSAALQTNNRQSAQSDALFAIADKWIQGLADWVLNPTKAAAVEDAQAAIANGNCAKLGADGNIIDSLPREVRVTFAPITGFQNDSGGSVLFGTPLYPQIIIAGDFDNGARPKLKKFTLLNLSNAEGRK